MKDIYLEPIIINSIRIIIIILLEMAGFSGLLQYTAMWPIQTEPDSAMIPFYPMRYANNDYDSSTLRYLKMNLVYDQYRRQLFEYQVKTWLMNYIMKYHQMDAVVIYIAPGHEANDYSSFMYDLITKFIAQATAVNLSVVNGGNLLVRHTTIPKQSAAGSNRYEETHRNSIMIQGDGIYDISAINSGKVVIILDDVWTSGCTLRVCGEKIRATGPKDVKLMAIGRTVFM